ncbi:anosmin-1-like isoform X1 [Acipenser oxyrinchus oxyrinchus]|uniref:Anosmin-1-like isoform X1 n=1 Tax=Acipenser oxyrinchus oxyrinchus TaxID=40147 RepID=A0AAD8D7N8_ACIOX|nr:anosmin-1-like isoform X1 [Acipenser oxyrinchus oxyrinchus]
MASFSWTVFCFLALWWFDATAARRSAAEDGDVLEKISSARCTSRCLTLHITQLSASFKNLQSDEILKWCENHRRCSQCLQPCKEIWETRRTLSNKTCEKHHECVTSSEFLKSILNLKQGDCPPPQKASGFAAACVLSCSADRECPGFKKCCSNGCGYTCQTPANLFKGVPLKPRKDLAFLEDESGVVEVSWMSKFNVSVEPVFYVLQKRWNYGIHPSEDESTEWQTTAMTTEDHSHLKDIRPNRWYQFRVAAINAQGTRGFTTPSKHFHSSRDPVPPEMPKNVRNGNFTVQPDGTVNVVISWDPPQDEDLSVHHYKVSWSQRVQRKHVLLNKRDSSKLTGGNASEILIEQLQPNMDYLIQVQAITYWGQKRLKSVKSQLVLTTTRTADTAANSLHGSSTGEVSNELPSTHVVPSIRRLEAAAPHYHNNQLQVKVFWKKAQEGKLHYFITQTDERKHFLFKTLKAPYLLTWSPVVCSRNNTKTEEKANVLGTHFVITGLAFACKYKVTVQPVSVMGQGAEAVTYVTTPQCSSVKSKGASALSCLRDERHLLARKVMLRLEKLTAAFKTVNGSILGEFHWQVFQNHPTQESVTGYQFSWTQLSRISRTSAVPDTVISQTQILSPDQPFLIVEHLQPVTLYRVHVHVLSLAGNGPATVKTFQTPQLNSTR